VQSVRLGDILADIVGPISICLLLDKRAGKKAIDFKVPFPLCEKFLVSQRSLYTSATCSANKSILSVESINDPSMTTRAPNSDYWDGKTPVA
jgi:hypothetical protein